MENSKNIKSTSWTHDNNTDLGLPRWNQFSIELLAFIAG